MSQDVTPAEENPYAAPQAELRPSASAATLASAAHTKYLRQGIVAGLQMGGFGAFITIVIYAATWSERSTVMALVLIPLVILFGCTLVGFLVGLAVQLFAMLFGVAQSDSFSLLPSLPFPSLEPPEYNARQELDKNRHYPPPPLS